MNTFNKKPMILIVDDIPENLRLLGNALIDEGYNVSVATKGENAIKITRDRKPDLILLDIGLRDIDGYSVCKEVKRSKETLDVPVIFLTAKTDSDDIVKGFDVGAVDYITKPFNQSELLMRVKIHLELKFAREKIEQLTFFDELAGIPNKRYFNKFFEIEWKRALREKTPISILVIDIDYFKVYNDTYGHLKGDRCINVVAKTIEKTLDRATDFVARFGGEEFVCVLPNTSKDGAINVAERIRRRIEDEKIDNKGIEKGYVTVSIGVATEVPDQHIDLIDFFNVADKRLYISKKNGKNRVS